MRQWPHNKYEQRIIKMPNKKSRSYLEMLADTIGNLFGLATVAGGGIVIGTATGLSAAVAGATTATATTAYNQFVKPEDQTSAYENAIGATTYVANTGRQAFDRAHPVLFSIGHMTGAASIDITASALNTTYQVGQKLYGSSETYLRLTDKEIATSNTLKCV